MYLTQSMHTNRAAADLARGGAPKTSAGYPCPAARAIGEYIVECFGAILVAYGTLSISTQRERIEASRRGWEARVLVGNAAGQPAFHAPE
ncbi:hypothetical protein L508_2814 [Bordetella bronchiseptica M435/02/3]|nr:hypothetical protein L508_2814 [Bordetella bronchiseptica M435/02/3]